MIFHNESGDTARPKAAGAMGVVLSKLFAALIGNREVRTRVEHFSPPDSGQITIAVAVDGIEV